MRFCSADNRRMLRHAEYVLVPCKMLKYPLQEQFRKALGYLMGWATEAELGPHPAAMQPPGTAG